jgi:hypothetical protein
MPGEQMDRYVSVIYNIRDYGQYRPTSYMMSKRKTGLTCGSNCDRQLEQSNVIFRVRVIRMQNNPAHGYILGR